MYKTEQMRKYEINETMKQWEAEDYLKEMCNQLLKETLCLDMRCKRSKLIEGVYKEVNSIYWKVYRSNINLVPTEKLTTLFDVVEADLISKKQSNL